MKKIPLTQGQFTIVDDEDYEPLMKFKWCAYKDRNTFYACRNVRIGSGQRKLQMHRHLLGVDDPTIQIDHRNGDGLDNQRANLRKCTNAQNQMNQRLSRANTSGYKGVTWYKPLNSWCARIQINKKLIHIGYYANINDAAIAYNERAKVLFGEFAFLNKK